MNEYGKFKKIFLIGLFIFLINLMNLEAGYFLTVFDSIILDFGIERGLIGWIIFGFFIGQAISVIFFGYYSDKYSRRKLLFLGSFLFSIFSIIIFLNDFTNNFLVLIIFRSLIAIGLGCSVPIGISMMMDLISSKNRSNVFSIFLVVTFLGSIVGFLLGFAPNYLQSLIIFIFSINVPWEIPYLYFGIAGLIGCGILLLFKEPKRAATEEAFIELISSGEIYAYKIEREDLKQIYSRPSNFWLIINFIDTIAPGLLLSWIIFYVEQDLTYQRVTYFEVIFSIAVILIGFLAGNFIFARIGDKRREIDKTSRAKIAVFCGVFNVPFVILAFLFPRFTLPFSIFLAIGMFIDGGIGPNWYSSLVDVNLPEHRGTMIALAAFLDTIGRAIGGLIGGYYPLETSILFLFLSIFPWFPVFKYIRKDLDEVDNILKERARKMSGEKISND
ncbi:MAG: MFS transporter [Candidatus Helarchaeota archaeon]|nr:MFS transporter [Candidatus Helarchaeota archaeon]